MGKRGIVQCFVVKWLYFPHVDSYSEEYYSESGSGAYLGSVELTDTLGVEEIVLRAGKLPSVRLASVLMREKAIPTSWICYQLFFAGHHETMVMEYDGPVRGDYNPSFWRLRPVDSGEVFSADHCAVLSLS